MDHDCARSSTALTLPPSIHPWLTRFPSVCADCSYTTQVVHCLLSLQNRKLWLRMKWRKGPTARRRRIQADPGQIPQQVNCQEILKSILERRQLTATRPEGVMASTELTRRQREESLVRSRILSGSRRIPSTRGARRARKRKTRKKTRVLGLERLAEGNSCCKPHKLVWFGCTTYPRDDALLLVTSAAAANSYSIMLERNIRPPGAERALRLACIHARMHACMRAYVCSYINGNV